MQRYALVTALLPCRVHRMSDPGDAGAGSRPSTEAQRRLIGGSEDPPLLRGVETGRGVDRKLLVAGILG
jgi:hypothetical protein